MSKVKKTAAVPGVRNVKAGNGMPPAPVRASASPRVGRAPATPATRHSAKAAKPATKRVAKAAKPAKALARKPAGKASRVTKAKAQQTTAAPSHKRSTAGSAARSTARKVAKKPAAKPVKKAPKTRATGALSAAQRKGIRGTKQTPKRVAKKATLTVVRGGSGRPGKLEPIVRFAVKELDPLRKCGPGTSVQFLYRVDESVEGRTTPHLVFFDRHGWYCLHGRTCPAVAPARKYNGHVARVS